MEIVEKHQSKQDTLHKAKFQITVLKNVLWSTENENMKCILNGNMEALKELIEIIENEGE